MAIGVYEETGGEMGQVFGSVHQTQQVQEKSTYRYRISPR